MAVYIGIDASVTHTGVCTWDGESEGAVRAEAWKPPKALGLGVERLAWFRERFRELFVQAMADHGRCRVGIEGYSYGSKNSHSHQTGELGAVIRLEAYDAAIPLGDVLLVPPSTLKKYVSGKGNTPKNVMVKEVFRKWGFDTDDDNIADAYSLMRFACQSAQMERTKAFAALEAKVRSLAA